MGMTKKELYDQYRNNSRGLEQHFAEAGYKYLGWQATSSTHEELAKCLTEGHMGHKGEENRHCFDIQHNPRGSDVTYWCDVCKLYWKIDMSD